jgi:carbamoyl-phosphate synthase/aspartate carbamoyltransferase/dihydroorotase
MLKLPGLIDPHVHLREPGQEEKEDFYTGTSAALAGGFTTIIDMPNNLTPITTLQRLEAKKALAKEKTVIDIGFHFGTLGNNLDEFTKITGRVMGLKIYLNHTTGDFLIDKNNLIAIFSAWPSENGPILLHAEENLIAEVIEVAKQTQKRIHICHISSENELTIVMNAKEQGIPITCGVTPHHLFLTEADATLLNQFGMMKPVLKTKKDVEFLWKNLKSIDIIESDHAPHTQKEKQSDQDHYGVPGLETTLPLLLTAVSQNRLTIEDVIRLCYEGSSHIFGIVHDDTTSIEIDQHATYEITNQNLFTKCKWSPFNEWKVKGKIQKVFIRGEKVFENGTLLAKPGSGHILP